MDIQTRSEIKLLARIVCPLDPAGTLTLGPGEFSALLGIAHIRERWSSSDPSDTLLLTMTIADADARRFTVERKVSARTLRGLVVSFSEGRGTSLTPKCLTDIAWALPEGSFLPALGFDTRRGPAEVLFMPSTMVAAISVYENILHSYESARVSMRGKAMWPNGEVCDTEACAGTRYVSRLLLWPSILAGPHMDSSAAGPLRAFESEGPLAPQGPVRFHP
jgi:hypothetical protein